MVFRVKESAASALSGVIGAIGHRVLNGPQQMFVRGQLYNAALVNGVVIWAASMAANYIGPKLDKSLPIIPQPEAMLVGVATLALSAVPLDENIPNPAVADKMAMLKTFALGAASELGGEYVFNRVLPTFGIRIR